MSLHCGSACDVGPARSRVAARAAMSVLALGVAFVIAGCGTLENKGGPGRNAQPDVFLVNIPPSGTEFSSSAVIRWYGTDADGRVVRYDYTVERLKYIQDYVADSGGGELDPIEDFIVHKLLAADYPRWTSVVGSQDTVDLYAADSVASCDSVYHSFIDPNGQLQTILQLVNCVTDTVSQVFFLRAVDDRGASSSIKYRSFTRRNHWPETEIPLAFSQSSDYISLPRLSETYPGIRLFWTGTDRLDVRPPAKPQLLYHWRVYGPYPSLEESERPTLADTLAGPGRPSKLVWESENPNPLLGVWVPDTVTFLYDLWRKHDAGPRDPDEPDTSETRSGYFLFVVTARDDASISDETPASVTFKAIYPKFERGIMLIDDTFYGTDGYSNPSRISTTPDPVKDVVNQKYLLGILSRVAPEFEDRLARPFDTLQDFWFRNQGPAFPERCQDPTLTRCGNFLRLEWLTAHKLVIWVNDDITSPIGIKDPPSQRILRQYLESGGMVWAIARHGLITPTEVCQPCPAKLLDQCTPDTLGNPYYNRLACEFFDIEATYYPAWRRVAIPLAGGFAPATNDEFVGARRVAVDDNLPPLMELNREHLDSMFLPLFTRRILCPDPKKPCPIIGVPDIDFVVKGSRATPLYEFVSWRPNGPIPPLGGPSVCHGKVVGLRLVGPNRSRPQFKTAYFTYPMYFMQEDQVEQLFRGMIDWFLKPFSQS